MSLGLRSKMQLHYLPHDLRHYKAPRPPYRDRIVFAMQLVGAAFVGYAAVVLILSLQ